MSSLTPFTNGEFNLELIPEGDSFKVAAPGLAKALGFRQALDMLRAVPDDDKGYELVRTPGGDQEISTVSEAGFYRCIGQRQSARIKSVEVRAQVERFQTWVYGDVLPEIRRTGSYGTPAPAFEIPQTMGDALRLAAEQHDRAQLEQARADRAEHRIALDAPKVAKAEAHSASRHWISRQVFAREVQKWGRQWGHNIHQESVYEVLRRKGMLISGNRADRNHATAQAEKAGWATVKKGTDPDNGHSYAYVRISPRGQDLAWKWINQAVNDHGEHLNPKATP